MKYIIPIVMMTILVTVSPVFAAEGDEDTTNWNLSYSNGTADEVRAIVIDSNNNVYIAGHLGQGAATLNWTIKKFNSSGAEDAENWSISFGYPSSNRLEDATIDNDGNLYFVGSFIITGDRDAIIKKYYPNGTEIVTGWNKTFIGSDSADDEMQAVAIDSNNNVYVGGFGNDLVSGSSGYDWWIKKFSSDGTEDTSNWNKTYDRGAVDVVSKIAIDSEDNVFVVGYGEDLAGASTNQDWWIKKFSSDGTENMSWNKNFTGNDATANNDASYDVAIDCEDSVYVVGVGDDLISASSNMDAWVKKFFKNGTEDYTWNKTFEYEADEDTAFSVAVDLSGDVYVGTYADNVVDATSNTDWWIKKYSSDGIEDADNWNLTFTTGAGTRTSYLYAIESDNSNSVYAGGYGVGATGTTNPDWWIKKFEGGPIDPLCVYGRSNINITGSSTFGVDVNVTGRIYEPKFGNSYVPGNFDITQNLSVGSNTLFVDVLNGRVGIGITPTVTLYVDGDINVTADVCIDGSSCLGTGIIGEGIWYDNGAEVKLNTSTDDLNATTLFVNNTLEMVGINTVPNKTLHVKGYILQTVTTNASIVGRIESSNLDQIYNVYVQDRYAYTVTNVGRVGIIDITDKTNPSFVGTLYDVNKLNGGKSIQVVGKYAYVASSTADTLTIIDVSNASKPVVVGNVTDEIILNGSFGLYVSGKYAYIAALYGQFVIVDISDPATPTIVSNISKTDAIGVYVQGKYAYLGTRGTSTFSAIDVSDPLNPRIVGEVSDAAYLNGSTGIYVSGKYAYVASYYKPASTDYLTILNVSNPSNPHIVGTYTQTGMDGAFDVQVAGKYAYLTAWYNDRFFVFDISDPENPIKVSELHDSNFLDGSKALHVAGKYAYVVAYGNDSLAIIDLDGIDAPTASIGSVEANQLHVTDNMQVTNDFYVGSGLNVGGSIISDGPAAFTNGTIFTINGTVGINNTKPTQALDVAGNINVSGNGSYPYIYFGKGGYIYDNGTHTIVGHD